MNETLVVIMLGSNSCHTCLISLEVLKCSRLASILGTSARLDPTIRRNVPPENVGHKLN